MQNLSKNIEYLREKSAVLPRTPGVYIMQNDAGHVIYVGKSRSLRDRVSQYFHGSHDEKTSKMVSSVHDFRFITCDTEMEALALENSLIKQYAPKYNIKLKDAKSYPYIKINTKSPWPRISMSRNRIADGALYFGPYSSTATVYEIIAELERTLKIPTCKRKFPEDIGKERPCVYYQIGRCMGVCTGKIERNEYTSAIDHAAAILRGGTRETISALEQRMNKASENLQFEEAARCRDSIEALKKLSERQKAVGSPDVECDVIGLHFTKFDRDAVKFRECATVFYIRSGYIADSDHFIFGCEEITENDSEADFDENDSPLCVFLMSLYQSREYIPNEILLSFELPEHEIKTLSEYLNKRSGHRVNLRTPKKGASKYLCEMAVNDAEKHSENQSAKELHDEKTLAALTALLGLEVFPERIEAYDISNLGNEHITAGMVVAINGRLKKSEYRMFGIKSTEGQDDYSAMSEALSRRITHIGEADDKMSAYPDLILLDGGRAHVSVIKRILRERGYDIPVFGMVKDEHHKTRTLVDEENEINIARHADVFRLIYAIQEEVHRYTVSRMTNAKRKSMKSSALEQIKGIGPAKAAVLSDNFKSFEAIKKATLSELSEIKGISKSDALAVYNHFNNKNSSDYEVK